MVLLSFGMIFNKAHVAFAIHRLGEYHITVALRILYTQTVGNQISRCIVWCLIWVCSWGLSPPVKYFTDRSKAALLLWIFYVFVLSCVCYVLCASVYMCFVVTCWEGADLLALVCGVFCEFVTFPLVSWVRCGT